MTTQLRSTQCRAIPGVPGATDRPPAVAVWLGRLVQVILALYLIPALLVVFVVGGIGLLVLAVTRLLTVVLRGPTEGPRTPVGPASLSS